jgi:hypothetical protein
MGALPPTRERGERTMRHPAQKHSFFDSGVSKPAAQPAEMG